MKKLLIILSIFISYSCADFIGINPAQLQNKIDQKIKIIDIRTPIEWQETGLIPTSHKMMFFAPDGSYDIQAWLDQLSTVIQDQNEAFVLVCRHGNRTGVVGEFLSKQLKFKNVFHLEHGIVTWLKENRKTVN